MINLDTDQLQDMINILQSATDNIYSAAEILLSVTTHDGWACKERYTINNYVLENRRTIQTLQEDCSRFCTIAKSVADSFAEEETNIAQMFSSVETALAQILANPVSCVLVNTSDVAAIAAQAATALTHTDSEMVSGVRIHWADILETYFDLQQLSSPPAIVGLADFGLNKN